MPTMICSQIQRWQFANGAAQGRRREKQTHEKFGAPLLEEAINARISALSKKAVVI
tara:strand:- start:712 stop:879 length:168 start_codon:yes stop_codon:yes gene_type:complete